MERNALNRSESKKARIGAEIQELIAVKMSLIPRFFGHRSDAFDPFSIDPFEGFRPLSGPLAGFPFESSTLAHARVDWRETPTAHVFKADVPGPKKEEVKMEIEDDRMLQISGERSAEKEEKNRQRTKGTGGKREGFLENRASLLSRQPPARPTSDQVAKASSSLPRRALPCRAPFSFFLNSPSIAFRLSIATPDQASTVASISKPAQYSSDQSRLLLDHNP